MRLLDLSVAAEDVLRHPSHQAAQQALVAFIERLRAASSWADVYSLQEDLLDHLTGVESDRNAFSQAAKRIRAGKSPQVAAPEPQMGIDPASAEAWQLEAVICERIGRQYRSIGDALAWRLFGFERRYVLALCRNEPAGIIAGKAGLDAEVRRVREAWKDGRFAIMHDLTNCLRIGDITVFGPGAPEVIEVKSAPQRRSPAQKARIRAAQDALEREGPLPGPDAKQRLYDIDVPFKTRLDLLELGTRRAASDGIFTARVPGNRVLVVVDLYGCELQGWEPNDFGNVLERKFDSVLRRAGLSDDRRWHVTATSLDAVSRDPLRVPLASYPLHPVACARLIGDLATFIVETSGPALADMLLSAGVEARWVHPPSDADIKSGETVMEIVAREGLPSTPTYSAEFTRILQMRRSELDRYLIELVDPDTWISGVKGIMADIGAPHRPWPCYRDEHSVWL